MNALVEAWLQEYDEDDPSIRMVGLRIGEILRKTDQPRLRFWADAQQDFCVFDAVLGPDKIAELLVLTDDTAKILTTVGLDEPARTAGAYFEAVVRKALERLDLAVRTMNAPLAWERVSRLLEAAGRKSFPPAGGNARKVQAFSIKMNGRIARACLGPWAEGKLSSNAPRDAMKAYLLSTIGDPRIYPAKWSEAGEENTRFMRSLIAAETLEAFFALIGAYTNDTQWQYRRAFWRACLKKVSGAEVWVILGTGLVPRARTVPILAGGFGRHTIAGKSDQAALLFKIGNLVFLEWSHKGALKVFDAASKRSPPLYETRLDYYSAQVLGGTSLQFPHHPVRRVGGSSGGEGLWHRDPEKGLWQGCAAALLETHLRLRVTEGDYFRS